MSLMHAHNLSQLIQGRHDSYSSVTGIAVAVVVVL